MLLSGCDSNESTSIINQTTTNIEVTNNDYLHPLGRTSIEKNGDNDMLYFANSCSGFEFQINVTSSTYLKFSLYGKTTYEKQYAKVYVDNEELEILEIQNGTKDYTLTKPVDVGEHEIKLIKLNEPNFSKMGLIKIYEGSFEFKQFVNSKSKKIEFYGDSISCGYGNKSTKLSGFSMEEEDGSLAYTELTAEKLNYENSVVSYSGIAMALSPFDSPYTMLDKYKTIDGDKEWNFENYVPDIIVINIGTNDNTKLRDYTGNAQIDAINTFYANLRTMSLDLHSKSPNAKFIFAYNMMVSISGGLVTCMESVCRELNEDDEIAYVLEFTPENKGADGHPSVEGHKKSASALADFIKENIGG